MGKNVHDQKSNTPQFDKVHFSVNCILALEGFYVLLKYW